MKIALTEFAAGRHFAPQFAGTKITSITPEGFIAEVNRLAGEARRADGYAPFCRHLFIPNFTDALDGVVEITPENAHLLRTRYEARREGELPVLNRFFKGEEVGRDPAKWLDLVLYSSEQCAKEGIDIGDADWGIVAILSAPSPKEAPMKPITMMRNALGIEQGGSGHPINKEEYINAVLYWTKYATVK